MSFDCSVPRIPVGDLFDFKNGLNKGKEFFGHGSPIVNYVDVYRGGKLTADSVRGLVDASEKDIASCNAFRGDVFFTRTSETKDEIGKTAALVEDIPSCVFSGFLLRARPKTDLLNPSYCAYCFETHDIRKWIVAHSSYTTRALTNGKILSKLMLPVPSLEKQREITDALDVLYALVNDISAGLPAEIAARRKQYEYYRDKLLTFKEKTA